MMASDGSISSSGVSLSKTYAKALVGSCSIRRIQVCCNQLKIYRSSQSDIGSVDSKTIMSIGTISRFSKFSDEPKA